MAKKKTPPPRKSPDARKRVLNKTFSDKAYIAVKKVLRAYGLDPDIFDKFSKAQRSLFINMETESPKFKVAEGHRMPRQLVNLMTTTIQHFLRHNYYGDRSNNLTYLELATFGVTLYLQIMFINDVRSFPPEQMKIVDMIAEKFTEYPITHALEAVGTQIRKTVQGVSKVNFRIYGFDWKVPSEYGTGFFKSTVFLHSEESEVMYFQHNNQYHKAFQVKAGRVNGQPAQGAQIDHRFIFPERRTERHFDIYIQSHALLRIKERVDIFPAHKRNFYVMEPLLYMHRITVDSFGRCMFECYYDNTLFGYYPFVIKDKKIFVLTFLPLLSPITYRGALLINRFGMQKEDMLYLGMDKLSFFFTVDFSQIPLLQSALIEFGFGRILNFAAEDRLPLMIDTKKTLRVKKFFEHLEEAALLKDPDPEPEPDPI
jgi:hypothetical protein